MKDFIEWLVVTFILVFTFRAFVAEAFEIPTGSMAPNLYGLHREHTCRVCGTEHAYGFSPMPGGEVAAPRELICPNCGHRSDKHAADNPDNGDKILVLKWPFDLGKALPDVLPHGERKWWDIFKPRRWDVVVFKDPNDGTTNLIKRLVGLPGEVLEIIDGDIYTAQAADLAATAEGRLLLDKLIQPRRPTEPPLLTAGERSTLDGLLRIQRKTDRAQGVLWLPVYHHDYLPVRKRAISKDGRLWFDVGPHLIDRLARGEYQPGTVAADQMMGRAVLVIWPSAFPLLRDRLRLIPNVGELRLIR
jgi:signal peptidase I